MYDLRKEEMTSNKLGKWVWDSAAKDHVCLSFSLELMEEKPSLDFKLVCAVAA